MTPPRLSLPDQLPEGWLRYIDPCNGHAYVACHLSDEAGGEIASVYADPWRGEVEVFLCDPLSPAVAQVLADRLAEASEIASGQPAPTRGGAPS